MVATCICLGAVASLGCSAVTRHRVLTFLFDGVPPLEGAQAAGETPPTGAPGAVLTRRIQETDHGPYAAKLCDACHVLAASNTLVAPRDQLCLKCHELKMDKRYVHGPLASGGCLVCHDPHKSPYRYMLVAKSDTFCFDCHDREALMRSGTHEGVEGRCTVCHDAHMSDKKYLLK